MKKALALSMALAMSASRRSKSLSALDEMTSMAMPGSCSRNCRTKGGSKRAATKSLADTDTTPSMA